MIATIRTASPLSRVRCSFPNIPTGSTLPPYFFGIAFNNCIRSKSTIFLLISFFGKIGPKSSELIKTFFNSQICAVRATATDPGSVRNTRVPNVSAFTAFPPSFLTRAITELSRIKPSLFVLCPQPILHQIGICCRKVIDSLDDLMVGTNGTPMPNIAFVHRHEIRRVSFRALPVVFLIRLIGNGQGINF